SCAAACATDRAARRGPPGAGGPLLLVRPGLRAARGTDRRPRRPTRQGRAVMGGERAGGVPAVQRRAGAALTGGVAGGVRAPRVAGGRGRAGRRARPARRRDRRARRAAAGAAVPAVPAPAAGTGALSGRAVARSGRALVTARSRRQGTASRRAHG